MAVEDLFLEAAMAIAEAQQGLAEGGISSGAIVLYGIPKVVVKGYRTPTADPADVPVEVIGQVGNKKARCSTGLWTFSDVIGNRIGGAATTESHR